MPPPLAWIGRLVDVRGGEGWPVVIAFCYHFCLLCGYYAVRPLRETFGIERGAAALPWLYTGTALFSLLLHPLFARAVSRFPRRIFVPLVYHFFAANLALFFALLAFLPERALFSVGEVDIGTSEAIGYVFFVWLSVFNVFITSVFWSYMTDLFSPAQGERLFGALAAGGSAGAIAGGAVAWQLTEALGAYTMILIAVALMELAVLFVWLLGRAADSDATSVRPPEQADAEPPPPDAPPDAPPRPRRAAGLPAIGGSAIAGVMHVLRSPYLLGIASIMLLMTISNTYFYTQQAEIVDASFASRDDRTAFFGMLDTLTNIATLGLQFLVVGRLMRVFGLALTLVVLPIIFAVSFGALASAPSLAILAVAMVATRSGRYAVMRPAREVLYTVVSREDKYKAKNFNDTFVYRGGDLVGIWSDWVMRRLALTNAGIAWVGVGVAAAMGVVGYTLGAGHRRREAAMEPPEPAPA